MEAARLRKILERVPLPLPGLLPDFLPGLLSGRPRRRLLASSALVKATALEFAILAGHVLLYPSGIIQERKEIAPADSGSGSDSGSAADADAHAAAAAHATADAAAPAERGAGDPPRLPAWPHDRPVVLLHGFIDNRSVFVLLRRALAKHGRRHVAALNYSPLTCDIREAARLLGAHVEELCERTGQREVDIVGHSLGGLIARYYVQCQGGDARVRTLVTLGTPHGGTRVVPAMNAHPIVRQMRPGSGVIAELAAPAPDCRTRFVGFWSDLDQLMSPLETACVEHPDLLAHNVRVSGIGHLALPVHPAVATRIRQAIDDATSLTGAPDAASVA